MRYKAPPTIPIVLDRSGPLSLHEQIAAQVRGAVEHGMLSPGSRLPSTRTLAALLGVSRGVAIAAYGHLFAHGYLDGRGGSGTYVAAHPAHDGTAHPARPIQGGIAPPAREAPALLDLTPGPAGDALPLAAWRAAWREAAYAPPRADPPPARGLPELRRAIAAHLCATRGVPLAGQTIAVTGGMAHGLRTLLDAVHSGTVGLEDPAPPLLRQAARRGLGTGVRRLLAVPVDRDGACVEDPAPECDTLVIAPDGQVPLGRVLSAARRRTLSRWACRPGRLVVEIVPEGAFRLGPGLLPRLSDGQGVLIGDFSGVLTPALGLGYAVLPERLAPAVERLIARRGEQPSYVAQLAVARLLTDGTVLALRHRLGRLYEHRRRLAAEALAHLPGQVRWESVEATGAGLLHLPAALGAREAGTVGAALRARGVRVPALTRYHWAAPPPEPALVVGYGHLPDPLLRQGLGTLADTLARLLGG
jgi:GntR family transcriptional regulator/MocR family aminotransferase